MEHPVRASSKRIHSEKPGIVLLDRPFGERIFFGLSSGTAVGRSSNFHMNKNINVHTHWHHHVLRNLRHLFYITHATERTLKPKKITSKGLKWLSCQHTCELFDELLKKAISELSRKIAKSIWGQLFPWTKSSFAACQLSRNCSPIKQVD